MSSDGMTTPFGACRSIMVEQFYSCCRRSLVSGDSPFWRADDDVYVWVKRDVTAERIAEAMAAVLNTIVPNDLHGRELRERLRPTCDSSDLPG